MCFNKAIVQSMLKHVVFENGPLILQTYSQIFFIKHIDSNLPNLQNVSGLVTKLLDQ